ncbi:MAG: DsbA family oxidoreductase [Vibrio sp.]
MSHPKSKSKVKIDIISDVVCPWCVIGISHLKDAVLKNNWQDQVSVEWYPFELNPDMKPEGENLRQHAMAKYGITWEETEEFRVRLTELAKAADFDLNFHEDFKIYNTRKCHILLDYAHSINLQTQLQIALYTAYFTDCKDISNDEVLFEIGETVGLDRDEMKACLNDSAEHDKIDMIESQWHEMGISGVPTVILNNEQGVTGALSVEDYEEILRPYFK